MLYEVITGIRQDLLGQQAQLLEVLADLVRLGGTMQLGGRGGRCLAGGIGGTERTRGQITGPREGRHIVTDGVEQATYGISGQLAHRLPSVMSVLQAPSPTGK